MEFKRILPRGTLLITVIVAGLGVAVGLAMPVLVYFFFLRPLIGG